MHQIRRLHQLLPQLLQSLLLLLHHQVSAIFRAYPCNSKPSSHYATSYKKGKNVDPTTIINVSVQLRTLEQWKSLPKESLELFANAASLLSVGSSCELSQALFEHYHHESDIQVSIAVTIPCMTTQTSSTTKTSSTVTTDSNPQSVGNIQHLVNIPPRTPDPQPGQYHVTLLNFCHPNTSTCYGCSGKFRDRAQLLLPLNDMAVVPKTRRIYYDNMSRKYTTSTDFSRIYFHFNEGCIRRGDSNFTPQSVFVPEDLKPFLAIDHINNYDTVIRYLFMKNCKFYFV